VAGVARTRVSSPLRARRDLDAARGTADEGRIALAEMRLDQAHEFFAVAIAKALDGFNLDFAWIDRAVRAEATPPIQAVSTAAARPDRVTVSDSLQAPEDGVEHEQRRMTRKLHDAAQTITRCLLRILDLVKGDGDATHALMLLDTYIPPCSDDVGPAQPHLDAAWRTTVAELKAATDQALTCLRSQNNEGEEWIRIRLAQVGQEGASVMLKDGKAYLQETNFHVLLTRIAWITLDPTAAGAVPNLALQHVEGTDATIRRVVRLRVVRELHDQRWWQEVDANLEREFARALGNSNSIHSPSPHVLVAEADQLTTDHSDKSEQVQLAPAPTHPSAAPATDVSALIRRGKTWELRFQGKVAPLPDRKGLTYLQKLVASPWVAIDVHELKGVTKIETSNQPTLDDKARNAMRAEYTDANHQLEKAEKDSDIGGAEQARERLRVLSSTVGKASSRSSERPLKSEAEQVRSSVAQAIKAALVEIAKAHPEAHSHLTEFLVSPSGSAPRYNPPARTAWQVNLTGTTDDFGAKAADTEQS
jgi:hypothetical protein